MVIRFILVLAFSMSGIMIVYPLGYNLSNAYAYENNNSDTVFYSCYSYVTAIHCDPSSRRVESYLVNATAKLVYSSSAGSFFPSLASTPDGRLFFTEKETGMIRILKDGDVLEDPFVRVQDLHTSWEQGMLGLAIDPDFEQNRFVYVYYTYLDNKTGMAFNRLVRFTELDDRATDMYILIDKIPASIVGMHSGGAMAFGPDDKLYVTVGDNFIQESSQDPSILTGKILRINRDGTIPEDNPWRWSNETWKTYNNEVLDENALYNFSVSNPKNDTFKVTVDHELKKVGNTSAKIMISNNSGDVEFYRDYFLVKYNDIYYGKIGCCTVTRDWTPYRYLTLWMYGSNDNSMMSVLIKDGDWNDRNERYTIRNDFTGWKYFSVPLKETYPSMNFSDVRGIDFLFHSGFKADINLDGIYLSDSPDPQVDEANYSYISPVFTIGHRNMFGIAFNKDGLGIVTENGDRHYDEINVIQKGGNYGWPTQQGPNFPPEISDSSIKPVRSYYDIIAPTQAIYYHDNKVKELKDRFVFGSYMTRSLYALEVDKDNMDVIEYVINLDPSPLATIGLAASPEGDIYYSDRSLYRLESLQTSKKQIGFPVEIAGSADIKELQLNPQTKEMIIEMSSPDMDSTINIKIPKALLDGILRIYDNDNKALDYDVQEDPSKESNIIIIPIHRVGDLKLTIVATTVIPEFSFIEILLISLVGFIYSLMLTVRKKI